MSDHLRMLQSRATVLEGMLEAARQQVERSAAEAAAARAEAERALAEAQHATVCLQVLLGSTTWRATRPLRYMLEASPAVRRWLRRSLKAAWWTVTLQLPRRLAERQAQLSSLRAAAALPAPPSAPTSATAFPAEEEPRTPRQLRWYDADTPQVSTIVLNFNKAALTRACLESIWASTSGIRYEIVLVDNGSGLEEAAPLAALPGPVRLVRLDANRLFGEGNNIGAEAARGEFLCFLNNDTIVTPGWLSALMDCHRRNEGCGAVGPKFVYPDGRLQEAGALVLPDGVARQIGKFGDPSAPEFAMEREVHYVSAACTLMRRDLFLELGGFDLAFEPAYYEDTDLCFRVRATGRRVIYCPDATIIHHENASHRERPGSSLAVEINRGKFVERWRQGASPAPRRVRRAGEKRAAPLDPRRIVLFSTYNLLPGGGERYLFTLAAQLATRFSVAFASPVPWSRLRFDAVGDALGLDLDAVRLIGSLEEAADLSPDLFIAMGNEAAPPVPCVGRRGIYLCQFPFPATADLLQVRGGWREGYDRIVVNSAFSRRHALLAARRDGLAPLAVEVIQPPVPQPTTRPQRSYSDGTIRIVSIGRFIADGHCKRQDELIEAFRQLRELAPFPIELHLAGALHPEPHHQAYVARCKALAEGLPVFFHLNVEDATIEALLAETDLYWHGTGLGVDPEREPWAMEHFGISPAQAMAHGCLVFAANGGGPAEFIEHGRSGFLFRDREDLVRQSREVLSRWGHPALEAMRERATHAAAAFSAEAFERRWSELVLRLLDGRGVVPGLERVPEGATPSRIEQVELARA